MKCTKKPAVFDDQIITIAPRSYTKKVRDDLIEKVVSHGGCPVENVNPKVDFVVCSNKEKDDSEVLEAASRLKIPLVTDDWVTGSVKQGKMLSAAKFNPFGEADDDEEEEEEEEEAPTKKRKAPPSSSSSSSSSSKKVKLIKKGRSAVDPNAPAHVQKGAHVYEEEDDIYDVMLNQTNISHNNNKFYVLQLLEDDNKKSFWVWTRWGRVGAIGQSKLVACGSSVDKAKKEFDKKFREKTGNDFDDRANFEPVKGKYTMVELDYGANDDDDDDAVEKQKKALKKVDDDGDIECKLDDRLQYLVKLICNLSMMKETLVEMEFDINKMPLGKLKKNHINKGYGVLKKIEKVLGRAPINKAKLTELTNEFYSLIPHDFGMGRPPVLDTNKQLKKKMAMLEALGDIEIATSLLKGSAASGEHPIDSSYKALNTTLEPVDRNSRDWSIVAQYVKNTHAPTHTSYKLRLKELYAVERPGEEERFKPYAALGNQQLLWHGSRLTNWMGILSQGLRIAPPEAPSTGYMFGKGVYFADLVTKSANYCHASRENPVGVMLLSRVALGKTYDCTQAEFMNANKPGFDSTKGCGATGPDPAENVTMADGTVVPLGKPVPTGTSNTSLLYNEFIVYDVAQLLIKYLVVVEFKYS